MAKGIFLKDRPSRKKSKTSKSKKRSPSCPECGSEKGNEAQCSPPKDSTSPWHEVLQIYTCSQCKNTIPAHLWERWGRLSKIAAKKEWQEKYKSTTISQEKYFEKAIKLLEHHKLGELESHCKKALKAYPKYIEFWKLLGVAYGSLEEPTKARKAFLQALTLDSSDPMLLANYVTSCFHAGDKKSAISGIEAFAEDLDANGKAIVLDSLLEAVKEGLVKKNDLPKSIFDKLKNSENASDQETVASNDVEYIDEDGNPVDPADIDPEKMEFADKDGNPVDQQGNPIEEEPDDFILATGASEINKKNKEIFLSDFNNWFKHFIGAEFPKAELARQFKKRAVFYWAIGLPNEAKLTGVPFFLMTDPPIKTEYQMCGFLDWGVNGHALYYTFQNSKIDVRLRLHMGGISGGKDKFGPQATTDLKWALAMIDKAVNNGDTLNMHCNMGHWTILLNNEKVKRES